MLCFFLSQFSVAGWASISYTNACSRVTGNDTRNKMSEEKHNELTGAQFVLLIFLYIFASKRKKNHFSAVEWSEREQEKNGQTEWELLRCTASHQRKHIYGAWFIPWIQLIWGRGIVQMINSACFRFHFFVFTHFYVSCVKFMVYVLDTSPSERASIWIHKQFSKTSHLLLHFLCIFDFNRKSEFQ